MDKTDIIHNIGEVIREDVHAVSKREMLLRAQEASQSEHAQTLWQAIKSHRKAVIWSMLVSTVIIMESYDTSLVGALFAQPAFSKKYGRYFNHKKGYQVSGPWQIGLGNATTCGTIIGAFSNGYFTDRFGYRKVLLVNLVLICGFILLPFFAKSIQMLLVAEILCGIPWGVFATLAPAYAAEVCPLILRGYLTVYINMCWGFGHLIASGVLSRYSNSKSQWAYRIPFALQWGWPIPLFILLWFAPESPWWLVRRDKVAEAERSLSRLSYERTPEEIKSSVALMIHTEMIEKEIESGSTYFDCFKGIDLRRTEIVCITFACQAFSGSALGGNPAYFFKQAGLGTSFSFKLSIGGHGMACVGTILSWFIMSYRGRREIYVTGLLSLASIMLTVGFVEVGTENKAGKFGMGGLIVGWLFTYYLSIGPICYAIISETSSAKLRTKSVCLARIAYYVVSIGCATAEPYMVNPTEFNLKGKTAFVWATTGFLGAIWAFFRLPETRDRTYEELDIMFARKLSARKFAKYKVDAYEYEVEKLAKMGV
ncbi:general substrate transporter [Phyllosticta citriasiana]|uniref:General substrate transporter n=2 Tax=Phyllosticta citriasiana TaxID=595635 RepID=A0ABR1KDE9_9PEZI